MLQNSTVVHLGQRTDLDGTAAQSYEYGLHRILNLKRYFWKNMGYETIITYVIIVW
jgi:hypothetical protein